MKQDQTDKSIIIQEEDYYALVREVFSLREQNARLMDELSLYTRPIKAHRQKYMMGIKVYLDHVLTNYSTVRDVRTLYEDICIYADDNLPVLDERNYNPVWVSHDIKGYDLCRMFWGINKAVGHNLNRAGCFLKAVFPSFFSRSKASSLGSNLTKYDENMIIANIQFGKIPPREYFEALYEESKVNKQ